MRAERRFHAMGADAQVIVVGGPASLAREAEHRIADLERRWSRFDECSEVSALTRHSGSPVVVSPETRELVERAVMAWTMTGGLFDPTLLGALVRAGYDRSFEELGPPATGPQCDLTAGADGIEVVANTVRLPPGTGFDPGGIGKGLAADIVTDELRAAGAEGVCVNLGGDVRVEGTGPAGNGWTVAVDYPQRGRPIAHLGVARGAVATSTTLRRRWRVDGQIRHHLIDPATGRPAVSDVRFVTVVAGHAWTAEVFAKAVLLQGASVTFDLTALGAAALTVDRHGRVAASPALGAYLDEPLPEFVVTDEDIRASAS
ncbi:MAG TPA: FAD:protein FMN transferase [Acidimicrobiia bacterium]|nr:FAD:protein FMN transferase [Acidimicrobiia bacterium]